MPKHASSAASVYSRSDRRSIRSSISFHFQQTPAFSKAAVVISGHPMLDEALLMRVLIALDAEGIDTLLIATKADLPDARAVIQARGPLYESLGYPLITLSARADPARTMEAGKKRRIPFVFMVAFVS